MVVRFPITEEGLEALNKELMHFKKIERPAIIKAIASARALGDLSENAEYHSAKEKQGYIEAKISDLESKVTRSEVINYKGNTSNIIQFGAKVLLLDNDSNTEVKYHIVGDYEADLSKNMISITSPLAKAMVGKMVGNEIELSIPKGIKYYEILKIEY